MSSIFLLEVYDSCERYVLRQYAFSTKEKVVAKACEIEGTLFLDWIQGSFITGEIISYCHAQSPSHVDHVYQITELPFS